MGAIRDLVAILLLVIGPLALIVGGVVLLVNQPQAEPEPRDPVEEVVARADEPDEAAVPSKTNAMDHMLDGSDAFYQAELAREEGDTAKADRLLKAAITHFERAVTIDGNMADAHRSLATALDEAGNEDAALQHWRAYVVLEPEAPDAALVRELIAVRDAADALDSAAAPEPPAPAKIKKRLGRKDVLSVVDINKAQVHACLVAARERGEVKAGRHNLMVAWSVEPDGSVSNARLMRPKKHRKGGLGRCVVSALERWRFPPAQGRTPIKFPLIMRVD